MRSQPDAKKLLLFLALAGLAAALCGCGARLRSREAPPSEDLPVSVQPVSNSNAVNLSVDDVIAILRQVGLTDQQIFEVGEDLRNAMLNFGGAKISVGGRVDTALRVKGFHVWIQSLSRGSFIYDVKSHEFTLAPQAMDTLPPTLRR